jgi:hypothetical protein
LAHVATYEIEDIGTAHPLLLTGNFEACAVARCSNGASPWSMTIDCQRLPTGGTKSETCALAWQAATKTRADQAKITYQAKRLTEDAAIGVCAAAFATLSEGEIDEVTAHGAGVDYWVDNRRAVLEISGIEAGDSQELSKRHGEKTTQLKKSALFPGTPGYVFVVAFGYKNAIFSYHN